MSILVNPTWWLLAGALALTLLAPDWRGAWKASVRLAATTPVLVAIGLAAVANLGARAMLGYAVPGDFVQEIAAARSLRHGTPLYPSDINAEVRAALEEDPPALAPWLPAPARLWLEARQRQGRNRLVAQAHPPTLLSLAAPAIAALGPYRAYWALSAASLAAAALMAWVLLAALAPDATWRHRALAVLAIVSWQPVLATVRDGQTSVIVAMLIAIGWNALRRDRGITGGAAIGTAAALKLYPLLLLIPLATRRRDALAVALLVVCAAAAATTAVGGSGVWAGYAGSATLVTRAFADAPYNLSLLARMAGAAGTCAYAAYSFTAAVLLALTLRSARGSGSDFDVEFAGFVTLALALSPVAWHHYVAMLALPLAVLARAAWLRGGRRPLAVVLGLALVLSLPDDAWRWAWQGLPPAAALLASPGLAVLALWAALLHAARRSAGAPWAAASS